MSFFAAENRPQMVKPIAENQWKTKNKQPCDAKFKAFAASALKLTNYANPTA